jgi:hypothetical protein
MKTHQFILLSIFFVLFACQDKKAEFVEKVSLVACQDTKDLITNHANSVVPFVGKALVDYAVPESVKNGMICDCIQPNMQVYLSENFQVAELELMLIDKKARNKALQQSLTQKSTEILQCYKDKGFKGFKLIESFIKAVGK